MNNLYRGVIVSAILIIWTYYICKHIANKSLKKYIKILCSTLMFGVFLRAVKCDLVRNELILRALWYCYYLPILFATTFFYIISTWNIRKKNLIKTLKYVSIIGCSILFLLIITNDIHRLVFKINYESPSWQSDYTYGLFYYICFIWIFLYIGFSIVSSVKESRGQYKKQKIVVLFAMLFMALLYAVEYIEKLAFVNKYINDFMSIYSLFYMLALIIIVYKERYREHIEEQLYEEIENAIKDKTIMISKKISKINNSQDKKRDLAYIKMLVGYCKRRSNLIVIQKNNSMYKSKELELFIKEALEDARSLGIYGYYNILNNFEVTVQIASIIQIYTYNLIEYCSSYNSCNMLIGIDKSKDFIIINSSIDSKEELHDFEYNFEMSQYMELKEIKGEKIIEDDVLHIKLKIPTNTNVHTFPKLTEKETRAILGVKSMVHDILGQRLSIISRIIEEDNIEEKRIEEIKPLLKNILEDLDNNKLDKPEDMLNQIIYTCELAGTKVYVLGELPKNYIRAVALVKIIRECSTNAIRHANAQNVYIRIAGQDKIKMTISNDGNVEKNFSEGDGIKGIRNRVEELNGSVEINVDNEFSVEVNI